MTGLLRTTGVALLFLAGALAITLAFAATLFSVPTSDLPRLTSVLVGDGGDGKDSPTG